MQCLRAYRSVAATIGLISSLGCLEAVGHHSKNVTYDTAQVVEIAGRITEILWRNPHVRLTLAMADGGASWDVEGNSVSILQRMGVTAQTISVGDTVRIAGLPARQGGRQLFATHVLAPDSTELILEPGVTPRWSGRLIGDDATWTSEGNSADASGRPNGIFGVWSTTLTNPESFPLFRERGTNYPLTETAQAHVRQWQSIENNPYFTCTPMGMPRVMGQPYPIEFVDYGNELHLRIELHDLVRIINMTSSDMAPEERTPSPLGYSIGRWEAQTLVVATTHISWPYFNQSGVPQGADSEITERFTPGEDGTRLHYELTVNDPETFTELVTLRKYWYWRPGEEVLPFDCAE